MTGRRFFWSTIEQPVNDSFISTWRTTNTSTGSSASNQVKLPLFSGGTYLFTVNWGDGNEDTITVWNQAETTHTYAASGDYVITITGVIEGFRFNNTGDRNKILDISSFGIIKFNSNLVFFGCTNLNFTATDTPDLSSTTNFQSFFQGCSAFNSDISAWDVSSGTNFASMFRSATAFNQNIGSWNVSSGTNFASMFLSATNFNQNIGSWDVSSGTNFGGMFQAATAFNNGGNSSIGSWNVSSGTNFASMFLSAANFNQNIGSWDMASALNFSAMLQSATAFNNGGNSSIGSWNVGAATNFGGMFQSATNFNQNIGSWDVSSGTNFASMFQSATNFNQNIGAWDVSAGTVFTNFMSSKTAANYLAANLDAIYNGWTNVTLSSSITTSFGSIKYTAAATAAKALLTRTNATVTVTNAANNGSGLIRITTGSAHGRTTGDKIFISGVTGTTEANGGWIVTVIDATTVDLQASTFTNTYVSGGTFRTGYGWTITDGGI